VRVFDDYFRMNVLGPKFQVCCLLACCAFVANVLAGALPAQRAFLKASNAAFGDNFGYAVAISGNTVVVGAQAEYGSASGVNGDQFSRSAETWNGSGAVYVFVREGTNWVQQAYLKPGITFPNMRFGGAVAISGDTIVVGAFYAGGGVGGVNVPETNGWDASGAVYVFVRNGTNWSQQAYLKAQSPNTADFFGWSVSVSGDIAVVGAIYEASSVVGVNGDQTDNSLYSAGAAYVFSRNGTNWVQEAYLKPSNTASGMEFGRSVAASGNTVVVGASGERSHARGINGEGYDAETPSSGAAYVFVRSGTNWTQQAYVKASDEGGNFGSALALSGDVLLVGAATADAKVPLADGTPDPAARPSSGAAYVFRRHGTTWVQQARLRAPNADGGDLFGISVAVSGNVVAIGAWREDGAAPTASTASLNNDISGAGAAYVFVHDGAHWRERAYLKAHNPGAGDWLGWSVGLSGDTAVAGAFMESSRALAAGGDGADDSASGAGAAYVFTGFDSGPKLSVAADGTGGLVIGCDGIPDLEYQLQRALTVGGPWTVVATNKPSQTGRIEFQDAVAPGGQAIYRIVRE
jgi:hypothetical protein